MAVYDPSYSSHARYKRMHEHNGYAYLCRNFAEFPGASYRVWSSAEHMVVRLSDNEIVPNHFVNAKPLSLDAFRLWIDLGQPEACQFEKSVWGAHLMRRLLATVETYNIKPCPENLDLLRVIMKMS